MKLEWGRKIACPACAIPFYDMRKTSLVCPSCGNKFESSDIRYKKANSVVMDEIDLDDKVVDIPGFEFDTDVDAAALSDESTDLTDDSDVDGIKITSVE